MATKPVPYKIAYSSIGGACPTQAEGVVTYQGQDYPFHFNYRYGTWTFSLAHPGDDPGQYETALYYRNVESGDALDGLLPDTEVRELVKAAVEQWVAGRPSDVCWKLLSPEEQTVLALRAYRRQQEAAKKLPSWEERFAEARQENTTANQPGASKGGKARHGH